MAQIIKKITKVGSSYGVILPKSLIEWDVFEPEEEVLVTIERLPKGLKRKSQSNQEKAINPSVVSALTGFPFDPLEKSIPRFF